MSKQLSRQLAPHLGPLELGVLEAVWALGEAPVREVQEQLRPDRELAYTTVMTILSRLHRKGILEREPHKRGFSYRARYSPEELLQRFADLAVSRVLSDFGAAAVARFLERLPQLSPQQYEALQRAARDSHEI